MIKRRAVLTSILFAVALRAGAVQAQAQRTCTPENTVYANLVALEQPFMINRLGANQPGGMIFALARDVCAGTTTTADDQTTCNQGLPITPANARLKPYKRPRPIVLRVNQGQCLKIGFTNLLTGSTAEGQPPTSAASVHVQGLELTAEVPKPCAGQPNGAMCNDGSWVGDNPSGLVPPATQLDPDNPQITYTLYAAREGAFLLYSAADPYSTTGNGDGGQLAMGLFGAVHVEPAGAEWYRSQVTAEDLEAASAGMPSQYGQPLIDYAAVYTNTTSDPCFQQGTCRVGPVLRMICTAASPAYQCKANEIVHSDLTAVISGPGAGRFPEERPEQPSMKSSYSLPDRQQPFREFTIIYHEMFTAVQAFQEYYTVSTAVNQQQGEDNFGINYGMAGIGSEVLANRLGVGPMANCTTCKYEEFFLTSWAVGDPAMVVDNPASGRCTPAQGLCPDNKTRCDINASPSTCPQQGTCTFTGYDLPCKDLQPTKAFFPDDPSNVYHSYISDHTKFRILHGGSDLHHVHHQHAHQWLHSPDTSNGDYLDSQSIGPGSAFSLEMTYNASGNVNQTVGDSIFHCHFYPHFAGGMWSLWRVHDVYETGTELDAKGVPVTGRPNRALPDGEIAAGTPTPAVVPLPTIPMPPMPALVRLASDPTTGGTYVEVCDDTSTASQCNHPVSVLSSADHPERYSNPGFPFFIPGLAGQRAPHPPLDFAKNDDGTLMDGGLPRHLVLRCKDGPNQCSDNASLLDFTDFSKTLTNVQAFRLPEEGTFVEQVAMQFHSQRLVDSVTPENLTQTVNGYDPPHLRPAQFILNGLKPVAGAPFADPCIQYSLKGGRPSWHALRKYKAADIQLDVTFNKEGWHFPQQRMLSLWGDVIDYLKGSRPPEPFFFRANSGDCIEYTLANLVPNVYELDDFQVRTPTDIIGQHIHLVKFDVTSSDGATNGWNYEDGTFAPNEVTERILAINTGGGLWPDASGKGTPKTLTAKPLAFFGPGPGGQWMGAQATIQRWYTDRLFDQTYQNPGVDRTLRTVFTHDHFGPSTHQQAGLYAGLVIEPEGSLWFDNQGKDPNPFGGDLPNGQPLPGRIATGPTGKTTRDGGPTTWQAVIETPNLRGQSTRDDSFREFLFEFQDSTLTYLPFTGITIPKALSEGFCSDNGASCTPATAANMKPVTKNCKDPLTAVCYSYGFCSSDGTTACKPATSTTAEDVSACPVKEPAQPTCNRIAGIPSQNSGQTPLPPVYLWDTWPLDVNKNPELITLFNATNSFSVNYRNEPLFLRIDDSSGNPVPGKAGDMSYAYASIERPNLPTTGTSPYPPLTAGVGPNDPFTPLLRAYAGDDVQIRTLVGAHINPHNFTVHGIKWLAEPSFVDSGWRASQVMGISEHFEEIFKLPSVTGAGDSDYLYMAGAAAIEQAGGNWGLMRAYASKQPDLRALPQNPVSQNHKPATAPVCPPGVKPKQYTVVALTAQQALGGPLVYNQRGPIEDPHALLYYQLEDLTDCAPVSPRCKAKSTDTEPLVLRANAGDCLEVTLHNALPLSPFCSTDGKPCNNPGQSCGASGQGTCQSGLAFCSADGTSCSAYGQSCGGGKGSCQIYGACSNNSAIACTPQNATTACGSGNTCNPLSVASPLNVCGAQGSLAACNANLSANVGLHPQLVSFDVTTSNGFNAGNNPDQTVAPGQSKTYKWYAGNIDPKAPAGRQHIPIELGAANLLPTDTLNHHQYGLFGALVIEPPGSVCVGDDGTTHPIETCRGVTAQINGRSGSFRELVLIFQDGLNGPNTPPSSAPFPLQAATLTSDNFNAISLRSEPLYVPNTVWRQCSDDPAPATQDFSCVLANQAKAPALPAQCCTGSNGSGCTFSPCQTDQTPGIQTPILEACPGEQVRFRVLHAGGINTDHVFELYGHVWQEQPYMSHGKGCPPPAPTTQTNLYASSVIGTGNGCDPLERDTFSEYQGSRMGHGPTNHFDVLIPSAGGTNKVPGDYLYRSFPADHYRLGAWGVLRVTPDACIGAQGTQGAGATAGGGGR